MHNILLLCDLVGVAFFAIAGALVAGRKHMDLFGVLVLGCVTALGGGTTRDVLLGTHPIFWIQNPMYFGVAASAALCTFYSARHRMPPLKLMKYADAAGLALFTAMGYQKGFDVTDSYIIAIIMGVTTGVLGGVVRDVLADEVPLIFRREIYASASLAGALVLALISYVHQPGFTATSIAICTTLAIRLSAIKWELSLPVFALDTEGGDPSPPS